MIGCGCELGGELYFPEFPFFIDDGIGVHGGDGAIGAGFDHGAGHFGDGSGGFGECSGGGGIFEGAVEVFFQGFGDHGFEGGVFLEGV